MANVGPTQLIIILLIVVLLFGAKKIPEIAKGLGKGIKDFKGAMKDEDDAATEKKGTDSRSVSATTEVPPAKPSGDTENNRPSA